MNDVKISAPQLSLLLFLSCSFSVLEYTPALGDTQTGLTLLLSTLLGFLMQCAAVIPLLLLLKKYRGQDLIGCAWLASPALGRILAGILLVLFLMHLSGGYAIFSIFLTNIVYPQSSSAIVVLLLAFVCSTCSTFGLQGTARAASIVCVLFAASILFVGAAASDKAALLNLHAIPGDEIEDIVSGGLENLSKNTELFVLAMLLPYITKPKRSAACTYGFLILLFLFTFLSQFLILLVLGDFGMQQTFPYYALTSVIDISIFQRLDSLHVVLWIFAALFRCTVCILCIKQCTAALFPKKGKRIVHWVLLHVAAGFGVFFAEQIPLLRSLNGSRGGVIIAIVSVLPLILRLILARKEKRHAPPESPSSAMQHSA